MVHIAGRGVVTTLNPELTGLLFSHGWTVVQVKGGERNPAHPNHTRKPQPWSSIHVMESKGRVKAPEPGRTGSNSFLSEQPALSIRASPEMVFAGKVGSTSFSPQTAKS